MIKKWQDIVNEEKEFQGGYDLTNMRAVDFRLILKAIGYKGKEDIKKTGNKFVWQGKNFKIHTGNNPFTGEKDYLSYVGLYGKDKGIFDMIVTLFNSKGDSKSDFENKPYI